MITTLITIVLVITIFGLPFLIERLIVKKREIFGFGPILESCVNDSNGDFRGSCRAVWLNTNQVECRLNGGISGFFRLGDYLEGGLSGPEFHGIIRNGKVYSTERA